MFKYLIFNGLIFILSGSIFYVTITNIDPLGIQKNIGFVLFFLSFFLLISSFFTFLFFFGKELFAQKRLGMKSFQTSMRRGILVGFFIGSIALLQVLKILDIYETILLALFLILLEYIFTTNHLSKNK